MKSAVVLLLTVGCAPTSTGGVVGSPDSSPPADETAPGDSMEQVPGYVAGQALFTDDEVHPVSLTLDDAGWAALLAAPTTYVEATFSDESRSLRVGVRLKGYSSFQPLTGKPNIRVSFDHYVDGQRYDGLEAVDLINEVEDPAAMSEALAYRIFRSAGQPASRTGFA